MSQAARVLVGCLPVHKSIHPSQLRSRILPRSPLCTLSIVYADKIIADKMSDILLEKALREAKTDLIAKSRPLTLAAPAQSRSSETTTSEISASTIPGSITLEAQTFDELSPTEFIRAKLESLTSGQDMWVASANNKSTPMSKLFVALEQDNAGSGHFSLRFKTRSNAEDTDNTALPGKIPATVDLRGVLPQVSKRLATVPTDQPATDKVIWLLRFERSPLGDEDIYLTSTAAELDVWALVLNYLDSGRPFGV
ncbi:hypothetical protein P153DRAFT_371421 [Dothidotthia symphoricarpi CBS 119687]|uniref:Uncharacterized protein n=1 Tax=Dothidotthia symphoricarpi CBS 119687 TaxID=1392245 RepID=A0A6A5ZW32_9PLEO|nr:uncharacterized protein P153DRAFT_371421 [Dothidotthia symphoricarpi CBS 119687]KAF2123739.1 hypothetical protein P153DRAFT_371421 [Dothidotthia symphoricarpi CBS 119687]